MRDRVFVCYGSRRGIHRRDQIARERTALSTLRVASLARQERPAHQTAMTSRIAAWQWSTRGQHDSESNNAPATLGAQPVRIEFEAHNRGRLSCLIFDPRSGQNLGELWRNLAEISDSQTAQAQHWRGLAPDAGVGLLIRRSLVRAQVGEPKKSST